ncbi:ParB/Srx family N-terminal domain-containing protein [Caballeronia sp. LZ065]|uniref:ParB/Srx family N-terminal domain-containing protein n=1 Tax=Caballeronia sp. LZ065 TaxID=3038571 RepID=UPI002861FFF7|nr:ParB/Srx family N-terminal domain-containing protein [Caballeronia sp. LZ065]MDR5782535.1 ParB/Srx family N-terminal domain-containing protein [Caballeronia sp. LZ065]
MHNKIALSTTLPLLIALAACGGNSTTPAANSAAATDTASAPASASTPVEASAPTSASSPEVSTPPQAVQAGQWAAASAGQMLDVTLGELHPTQAALGYDQIYYKLGRYEADPTKKFDDFCADEGLDSLATDGSSASSKLTDSTSFTCTTTDTATRDTTVLNPVVIGPNGDSLFLTDGHHGLSTYYEVPDGGPTLHVHVIVKDNLSAYSGTTFWSEMQNRGYTRLKDANGAPITAAQLPAGLGLKQGMQNDVYRSLVYFTRDIGYSKPTPSTDFLEFYWADWLRANFPLTGYTLTTLGATDPDPATADSGYLNAVWNASLKMAATTDPIIDGKTGKDLGRLDAINAGKKYSKGEFGDLLKPLSASKPGKLAYTLDYKARNGLK